MTFLEYWIPAFAGMTVVYLALQRARQLAPNRYRLALRNIMALAKAGPTGQKNSL